MTWRTIILTKDSKLSLRMNHLVVKSDTTTTIPISEIGQVIIENPNITMTGHILNALSPAKVTVILCDERPMPFSQLNLIYGEDRRPQVIKQQMNWTDCLKGELWKEIVKEKIQNQKEALLFINKRENLNKFTQYINEVEAFDKTNREGHAAKIYFNHMFGLGFKRGASDAINWALNYGYSLLLSLFTRTIIAKGFLTEIGIHHSSQFNHYNLASDFMEVYRPIVDVIVKQHIAEDFGRYEKRRLLNLFNKKVMIKNRKQYIPNSIEIYVDGLLKFLDSGNRDLLAFPNLFGIEGERNV